MAAVTDTLKLFLAGDVMTAAALTQYCRILAIRGFTKLTSRMPAITFGWQNESMVRFPAQSISPMSGALRWMSSNFASPTHASSIWKLRCPAADDRSQRASITA